MKSIEFDEINNILESNECVIWYLDIQDNKCVLSVYYPKYDSGCGHVVGKFSLNQFVNVLEAIQAKQYDRKTPPAALAVVFLA